MTVANHAHFPGLGLHRPVVTCAPFSIGYVAKRQGAEMSLSRSWITSMLIIASVVLLLAYTCADLDLRAGTLDTRDSKRSTSRAVYAKGSPLHSNGAETAAGGGCSCTTSMFIWPLMRTRSRTSRGHLDRCSFIFV